MRACFPPRASIRVRAVLGLTALLLMVWFGVLLGQVNWQYIGSTIQGANHSVTEQYRRSSSKIDGGRQDVVLACGEEAHVASARFRTVLARLKRVSGVSSAEIYESVQPAGPHARPGGCIFYNEAQLRSLFSSWFRLADDKLDNPMIYAIIAHELGHLAHDDFSPQRQELQPVERELEADRFAGYMLSRLNIRIDSLTDYYRLTGDDFSGIPHDHGTSAQRAEAFTLGWRRAELGLPEDSITGVGSVDHP